MKYGGTLRASSPPPSPPPKSKTVTTIDSDGKEIKSRHTDWVVAHIAEETAKSFIKFEIDNRKAKLIFDETLKLVDKFAVDSSDMSDHDLINELRKRKIPYTYDIEPGLTAKIIVKDGCTVRLPGPAVIVLFKD